MKKVEEEEDEEEAEDVEEDIKQVDPMVAEMLEVDLGAVDAVGDALTMVEDAEDVDMVATMQIYHP